MDDPWSTFDAMYMLTTNDPGGKARSSATIRHLPFDSSRLTLFEVPKGPHADCTSTTLPQNIHFARIAQDALDQGCNLILILENDVRWAPGANITPVVEWMHANKQSFDLFYLGHIPCGPVIPVAPHVIRTFMPQHIHAVCYNRSALEIIAAKHDEWCRDASHDIDHALIIDREMWRLSKYAAYPPIAYQETGANVKIYQTPYKVFRALGLGELTLDFDRFLTTCWLVLLAIFCCVLLSWICKYVTG